MNDFPKKVTFHEEGPREGIQMEKQLFPLSERIALVEALIPSKSAKSCIALPSSKATGSLTTTCPSQIEMNSCIQKAEANSCSASLVSLRQTALATDAHT